MFLYRPPDDIYMPKVVYVYALIRCGWNDYTSAGLACMLCFDDWSFSPIITAEYEVFQGFTLGLSVRVPMDRGVFGGRGRVFVAMSGRIGF
jgi:hypothetical protein